MLNLAKTFVCQTLPPNEFSTLPAPLKGGSCFLDRWPPDRLPPVSQKIQFARFKMSIGGQDAIFAETYLDLFTKSDDKDGNLAKT